MGRSPTNTAQCLRQDLNQQYTKLVDTINNSQTKFIISLIISLDGRQTINKDEKEENSKKSGNRPTAGSVSSRNYQSEMLRSNSIH